MKRGVSALAPLVALLALAPPAYAGFPGTNGKIAFERSEICGAPGEQRCGIWSINPDATTETLVASPWPGPGTFANNHSPAWSANGQKIAFSRSFFDGDAEGEDVLLVNADGSGQTNVTNAFNAYNSDPSWSPDGTKIAFHRGPNAGDIYTINADGSGITRLTTQANSVADSAQPSWSPDGTKIAFATNRDHTSCEPVCTWYFDYDIYVMNADGSAQTSPTNDAAGDRNPNWSPDGTKIAFTRHSYDPATQTASGGIWTMSSDGTAQTKLIDATYAQVSAWSPDGTKIAFTQYIHVPGGPFNPGGTFRPEIYTVNADGSEQTLITVGSSPDWQPLPGPQRSDFKNAAQFCKAERAFMGASAFGQTYGNSGSGANAFGKCVSADGR